MYILPMLPATKSKSPKKKTTFCVQFSEDSVAISERCHIWWDCHICILPASSVAILGANSLGSVAIRRATQCCHTRLVWESVNPCIELLMSLFACINATNGELNIFYYYICLCIKYVLYIFIIYVTLCLAGIVG